MIGNSSKLFALLLTLVIAVSFIAGCNGNKEAEQPEPATRVITDMVGNNVTIPTAKNIQRAAVIHSPIVQVMYVVGAQDKLCAVTTQAKMWPLISKMDPNMQNVSTPVSGWEVNLESLLATNPDLCIGSDKQLSKLAGYSIPCLQISTNQPGQYFEYQKAEVRFFGDVFGKEARADNYCLYLDNIIAMVKSKTANLSQDKKPRVLLAQDVDHLGTYGNNSYMQEWLEAAGCRNAAENLSGAGYSNSYTKVSIEQMLAWEPDIILIDNGKPDDLYNDSVWSKFTAVKNHKVYRIPVGIFIWNRPCAEGSAQFPEWMAITAYPDLFKNLTMESEIKRFWSEIFKYNISDEDVYNILHPENQK